ncbi:MAG: hypothetical protein AAF335_03975 [Bacteroidota bacterium]
MNISPKLDKIRFFILYGFIGAAGLCSFSTSTAARAYEANFEMEDEEFDYDDDDYEDERYAYVYDRRRRNPKRKKTVVQEVISLSLGNSWEFIKLMNPLVYAWHRLVSLPGFFFFLNVYLSYKSLKDQGDAVEDKFSKKNIAIMFFKAFFFDYVISSVSNCLEAGFFRHTFRSFSGVFRIFRRLFKIILYTTFVGVCLLFDWLPALGIIGTAVILLSLLTRPREIKRSSYCITNLLFVGLAALFLALIVWKLEELNTYFFSKYDALAPILGQQAERGDPEALLMGMGDSLILGMWLEHKGKIFEYTKYEVRDGDNTFYTFLKSKLDFPDVWKVSDSIKKFFAKSERMEKIGRYIMQNILVNILK